MKILKKNLKKTEYDFARENIWRSASVDKKKNEPSASIAFFFF